MKVLQLFFILFILSGDSILGSSYEGKNIFMIIIDNEVAVGKERKCKFYCFDIRSTKY